MGKIKFGSITILLPDIVALDPTRAGNLTENNYFSTCQSLKGIIPACDQAAAELEKFEGSLSVPGVDPDSLRAAGFFTERISQIIEDMETALKMFKQIKFSASIAAFEQIKKVNTQVNILSKDDDSLKVKFRSVLNYVECSNKSSVSPTN